MRGARSFGIALFFILSCKKVEPVQRAAPIETASAPVIASSAPTASAAASEEPVPVASIAPSASASAASTLALIGHQAGYAPEDPRQVTGRPIKTPSIRQGAYITGKLPQEVVRRVVRRSFDRFRHCYEEGLRRNPTLTGKITAKYVIGRDGTVPAAQDGGSDLPDSAVVQKTLTYPQPEDGIVIVVFPVLFSPGE